MGTKRLETIKFSNIDLVLTGLVFLLCVVGLGLLYSAGYQGEDEANATFKRQAISMGIGFACYIICTVVSPAAWKRYSFLLFGAGCFLLVMILFTGIVAGGARRWLDLGGFRMQPSEFMKVVLILALARVFSSDDAPKSGYSFSTLIKPCAFMAFPAGLILIQPDLGTALCSLLIGGSMLLVAGIQGKVLKRLIVIAALLAVPTWTFVMEDYQKQRVATFLSPDDDPLGSGYHAIQSKIAVGSGSIAGKGFLEGTQTQLSFLPEQTTDFIFSVLAEEWGFIGSITVLILYGLLMLHILNIAFHSTDRFSGFVAVGVSALIFWHVLVNIGMVIGVMPVVGLTLPLLSYGGSSVVTIFIGLGLVSGVSLRRYLF